MSDYGQHQYNYQKFNLKEEMKPFAEFQHAPNAGNIAPNFALERLDSAESVEMKQLWKKNLLIVEFGSFT